ncbi:DNA methyltransferase [Vibrio cholerae]
MVSYGDGAYRLRGNAFSNVTEGRIPKNVIQRGHRCADTLELRRIARELGLPPHPAMFPTDIPEMAIRFLTEEGDLVVDPFSGSNKSGLAAERNNRRWIAFLCGIGSEAVATSFDVNDIQDEEIRNTLITMFEEEFEKTVKGDKWTLKN